MNGLDAEDLDAPSVQILRDETGGYRVIYYEPLEGDVATGEAVVCTSHEDALLIAAGFLARL